jgi:glucokinase
VQVVAVDIGGTYARFALANVEGGLVTSLGQISTLKTAEHATFETAWGWFGAQQKHPLPGAAAIAVACPVGGDLLKLTNNLWVIRPQSIGAALGVDRLIVINDFGAVGHAVALLGPEYFQHVCGPDSFPDEGVVSVLGPGTGLGVSLVLRRQGRNQVIACEAGHIDFAPLDAFEDAMLRRLRQRYGRVSVERIVSGPGLANIYHGLASIEGQAVKWNDDKALWGAALAGEDKLAAAALDRFCLCLGSIAGDVALAHGADAVVIAGRLSLRIAHLLRRSSFASRFTAKGRFEPKMAAVAVKLLAHPEPGLLGAAAAYAEEHKQ